MKETPHLVSRERLVEKHQVDHLLRLLDRTDELEMPVCIEHRDKPDFLLSTRGGRSIGVETSIFTDEEIMRAGHLQDTRYPTEWITTSGLRDRDPRRSAPEIINTMLDPEGCWDGVGDHALHVVKKILEAIAYKRQKFLSPAFEKFTENWLLLTAWGCHFSDLQTHEIISKRLSVASRSPALVGSEFARIYIFYGPSCFKLTAEGLFSKIDRNRGCCRRTD